VLPTAGDADARVVLRDRGLDLARVGPTGRGDGEEIWELPVVWQGISRATIPQLEIEVDTGGRRARHTLCVSRPLRETSGTVGQPEEAEVERVGSETKDEVPGRIDLLWRHHAEIVQSWCGGGPPLDRGETVVRHAGPLSLVPLDDFCGDYWRQGRPQDAEHALIVEIARRCHSLVERLARSPRRVLRRERRMVPLAVAQQVDAACLRWLVRQPGRSIAQKAGPRQRVMAVVREPSIDTPENRVLRRFLELCAGEANWYARAYREFATSSKVVDVKQFDRLVRAMLRGSELRSVPPMVGVPEPNYVLQFDPDYSQVWHWYLRLIRQKREQENLRAWHHRTWAERCRIAVLAFLEKDSLGSSSFRGWAHLRGEPFYGTYLSRSTSAGPWAYRRTASGSVLRAVAREGLAGVPGLRRLAGTACDWALVIQDAFDSRHLHAALGIYSMHLIAETDAQLKQHLCELEACIRPTSGPADTPLRALVLVPSLDGTEPSVQSPGGHVTACRIPGPEDRGRDRGWTALGRCLEAFARWRDK
jgi:hypothetical protein